MMACRVLNGALRTEAAADLSSEEPDSQSQPLSVAFTVPVLLQCLFAVPLVMGALQVAAYLEFLELLPVNMASQRTRDRREVTCHLQQWTASCTP